MATIFRIIPGLCVSHDDNHNVMRGEETQLIGAASSGSFLSLCHARNPLQMGAGR
ncbi:2-dehydro-3-deoxygalactonokinase [Escherichia coli]